MKDDRLSEKQSIARGQLYRTWPLLRDFDFIIHTNLTCCHFHVKQRQRKVKRGMLTNLREKVSFMILISGIYQMFINYSIQLVCKRCDVKVFSLNRYTSEDV